ncbi:hypothetical protein CDAR_307041 [Caerostris darwini]|uniref:Uncharacterized protein n=1 Tax=Caerostris darwini TaxID=1538125 RepID=A0AAV4RU45_9ARAC|nr:hypothetical protein CDAR_307041 [Caerostris darwini]
MTGTDPIRSFRVLVTYRSLDQYSHRQRLSQLWSVFFWETHTTFNQLDRKLKPTSPFKSNFMSATNLASFLPYHRRRRYQIKVSVRIQSVAEFIMRIDRDLYRELERLDECHLSIPGSDLPLV